MLETSVKPTGTNWTDEQWMAISGRGTDILVAAAAGSGKTAVLVERIIRMISEGEEPLDVDRLLVATFTKAAADEMRQRIREALEKKLSEQPHSDHLRRQLAYIHRASITTLHSFCLDVVRAHYQSIDLDPSFRIGNETEIDLIRQDVLEEMFEDYYANSEQDSDFWRLIDAYSGERSDEPLFKLVLQLYDFSRSHPWPEHWLDEMAQAFAIPLDTSSREQLPGVWLHSLQADVTLELKSVLELLQDALHLAQLPAGPAPYAETLQDDIQQLQEALLAGTNSGWDELYQAIKAIRFSTLKRVKKDEVVDERLQAQVKELRDLAKKQLATLQEECFERTLQQFAAELIQLAPLMFALVELVKAFAKRYTKAKQDRDLVDFSDLEHYCLAILRGPGASPDHMVPSRVAEDYQAQFAEILLDEYQDTNLVQEAIISLISRTQPGNRFMVGDVKQSIYRFRLAEPGLFLQKFRAYATTTSRGDKAGAASEFNRGARIDLAKNFRSRKEVVDGVNFIFKQIMNETVGEMEYDDRAKLVYGATYPLVPLDGPHDYAIEFTLLDRSHIGTEGEFDGNVHHGDASQGSDSSEETGQVISEAELETAQLEARYIALQIRKLLGGEGEQPFQVYDQRIDGTRPIKFSDIVILLRATQAWAPVMIEELRLAGIPAYAELSTGYFQAGEIEIMMSLLRVIDNPYQDIPLAAVLRSPLVRLSEDELAQIRIASRDTSFYDAVKRYVEEEEHGGERSEAKNEQLRERLVQFLNQLELWRNEARESSVADLIWRIYRMTGWFDFVGGMPGGVQRQANLRALYDRARQYEKTSFRGLFRFLRFVERMQELGGDLGTAGAIGEQEDVVRIMSIHKSKGLEFPVVFLAGLGKQFNQQDLNGAFLMHKELGFGPKVIDPELRVSYPSLPNIVIRRRMRMELLAEEMRVLYVALTRAKEKLFLLGTVADATKQAKKWATVIHYPEMVLPDSMLVRARSYLDWIGPALLRHPQMEPLRALAGIDNVQLPTKLEDMESRWKQTTYPIQGLAEVAATRQARDETIMEALYRGEPIFHLYSPWNDQLEGRLNWRYRHPQAAGIFSKTSVSEMKRKLEVEDEGMEFPSYAGRISETTGLSFEKPLLRRPRFMEQQRLTAAERGTIVHTIMQHIDFRQAMKTEGIQSEISRLLAQRFITEAELEQIDMESITLFFRTKLAERIVHSKDMQREVPFSFGLKASEAYPEVKGETADEIIIVQGVIDCIFEEEDELVLIDYKTDAVHALATIDDIKQRYTLQIQLYRRAIEQIWHKPVKEAYLYLLNGGHLVEM